LKDNNIYFLIDKKYSKIKKVNIRKKEFKRIGYQNDNEAILDSRLL